jgi:protocatechuate 3,4-dioxygenase beta subunit
MSGSSISGNIFSDQNADGSIDGLDAGLSGVVVDLLKYNSSTSSYTTTSVTTNSSGSYSFTGLAAGTYSIKVVAPSGESFSPAGTSAAYQNATLGVSGQSAAPFVLAANTNLTNQDAGLYVPASFTGTVFNDSNDDGLEDNADTGLSGVTVQLLNGSGAVIGTTTTASNGTYTFGNLAPGTYSAHVVAPTGATYSVMGSNATPQPTGGIATPSSPNLITDGQFNIWSQTSFFSGWTTSANTTALPYGSGPGAGPEVYVYNEGAAAFGTPSNFGSDTYAGAPSLDTVSPYYSMASTTAAGTAAFFADDGAIETLSQTVSVVAGTTYEVGFDLNETLPGAGNSGFFSLTASINGVPIVTAGSTSGTILTPGTWTHFADLFTATATGPVTLTFTYESGVPGSTLTSKDVLVDDVYVAAGQYTKNLTTTSEVNPGTGTTTPVTLASGQTVGDESAGIHYQPATIQGTIFADSNANGVEDSTDTGVAGVTVNLRNASGLVIATTTTAANGKYTFANQAAGTYTVQVGAPSGDTFSPAGSSATLTDSTVSTSGAQTVTVANGAVATVNAGLHGSATVSGLVFTDLNADGTADGNDAGIAGQTVTLLSSNGSTVIATSSSGSYAFTGVAPGSYTVQIVGVSGETFSSNGVSASFINSTVSGTGASSVTVVSGGAATANAGEYAPSTITGTVFNDANADGIKETGDSGLANQIVSLLSGSTVIATTTTTSTGTYSFAGVAPGSYTVSVTAAAGDTFSTAGSSPTLTDSTVSSTGSEIVTVASGVTGGGTPTTIVNLSADPSNPNAGTSSGAATYNPVLVTLGPGTYSASVIGTAQGGAYNAYTIYAPSASNNAYTDSQWSVNANGTIQTEGSVGGFNSETSAESAYNSLAPIDFTLTSTETVAFYVDDSAFPYFADDSGGVSLAINQISEPTGSTVAVNAGEYAPSTITGTVFNDANADGIKETGDSGLAGQTVSLLSGSTVIATTTTTSTGTYSFAGVAPGSYTVSVTKLAGDTFSTAGIVPVTATSGSATTANIGEYDGGKGTITSTVFLDGLADGTYHAGDPGVEGVTVKLLSGSTVVATTTTTSNGTYTFTGVTPGSYTVDVVAPAGMSFSPTEHASGNPLLDSDVNPTTGLTGTVTVTGNEMTQGANAGLVFNGNFAGTTPINIGSGTAYSGNSSSGVIVGSGNDNVHTGNGGNNVVVLGGGNNIIEEGSGATTDIGTSTGALNAQTQNAANGFLFAGTGNSTLQGEQGNVYLVGGTGNNLVAGGSGNNLLVGGISSGTVTVSGTTVKSYTTGSEVRITGTSATILYQKGDGVQVLDNTFNPAIDKLEIFGYSGGRMETLPNGEEGLYLGGNDLIIFNGGNPFTNATGASFPGITFNANVAAAPQYVVTFGSNGLPEIVLAGGATTAAPVAPLPSTVTGTVFNDVNGDGTQTTGESGLSGQAVTLLNGTTTVATTTTAANGTYSFTGIAPGSYTVHVAQAAGKAFSTAGSTSVTTTSGSSITAASIGEYVPATVSGTVFNDTNKDGTQETGETGLSGQTVTLLKGSAIVATTTTGAGGTYSFSGVAPGGYTVKVTTFAGDTVSSGGSTAVTAAAGSSVTGINTGEYATAPAPTAGPTTVTMSAYNQSLTLDNQNYSISGSQGNATISVGGGTDTINAGGYNNTITLGGGNDTVTGPQGNTTITATGAGNDTINVGGYGDIVTLGNGNNSITGPQGNATVVVGSGNNTVTLAGNGNVVTTGSGNNTVIAGAGGDTVNTQGGNDAVTLSGWTNFVTGGTGADSFIGGSGNTYQISGVGSSSGMTVKDFSFNNGDVLDLSKVLAQAGWNNAATTLAGYLKVSEVGTNTVVAVDPTGGASSFHTVATLDGLGASTLATLQSHNAITL